MAIIEVEDLKVNFIQKEGVIQAVRGISYAVEKGESLGIVGESGSGKSVSALALMRLIKEPPGKVEATKLLFEGKELREIHKKEMRKIRGSKVSMVFQEPMTAFDPVFTIGQQLSETIQLHKSLSKREAMLHAAFMLEKVDIPHPDAILKCYPHQLSGGMRQRAMIAMALSCNPQVLIADEPTTALDVTIQAQVLQLIKELQEESGMALMMITHDLGVIAEMVDRVIVMYGGKIMETGSVFDIFEKPSHPYTIALLKSIPTADKKKTRLYAIEGNPPNPMYPPQGCPFHQRCSIANENCKQNMPPMFLIEEGHLSFCWRNQ